MTNLSHNFDGDRQHPPQDDFLLYVDGELEPRETERWESHLDACWSCRVRVAKIEETISDIIGFEDTVSQFQFSQGPSRWGNFDSLLHAAVAEGGHRSVRSRFFDFFQHFYGFRFAAPAVAALLIVAIVYQFVLVAPVSAAELLEKAVAQQQEALGATEKPVVFRRLKVSAGDDSVTLGVWSEVGSAKNRKSNENVGLFNEFEAVMTRNGLDAFRPLSPEVFRAWHASLPEKTDEVVPTRNGYKLTTVITAPRGEGDITSASLAVRSSDWHAVSQSIEYKSGDATKSFDVAELEFRVIARESLTADFFEKDVALSKVMPANAPGVVSSPASGEPVLEEVPSSTNTSFPAATTAAEVEVLELLHKVGADISEQLNVTRTADGRLLVEGLVESDGRKKEILGALVPVRNNPAIRIKIQTIEEARRALQRQKQQATPGVVDRIDVEQGALPVDSELRQHFASRGGDVDAQIRQFASRVTSRSQTAALQASALNRMANRFNAAQLAELEPAARSKWLGILKGYAAAVRRETAALRGELQPVFGGMDGGGAESITSDADLIASARRLYELASANDRVVRSAFTLSSGGSSASALRSASFRRSIAQAEALAAAIERAR